MLIGNLWSSINRSATSVQATYWRSCGGDRWRGAIRGVPRGGIECLPHFGKEESADSNFTLKQLIGHAVSDAKLEKVAALSQRLCDLQPRISGAALIVESQCRWSGVDLEFGADLSFQAPARFLVDTSLGDGEMLGEESASPSSMFRDGCHDHGDRRHNHFTIDGENFDLSWLRDACDQIIRESTSQLSKDDLAMAICHVLNSGKPSEEIAGDLLDLVGDSSFRNCRRLYTGMLTIALVSHYYPELVDAIHRGLSLLKSNKMAPNTQSRMPSHGTRVTIQIESAKQIDKLRRKEEKRKRRGTEHGVESDVLATSFSSLFQASERTPFIDSDCSPIRFNQETLQGYEEVIIPSTPTIEMKPGESWIKVFIDRTICDNVWAKNLDDTRALD
ncbi:hypothetical protein SADUNF_Sadunf15G0044400 [Salix dunnii]|uniref:Uncharacterized protein n=1 Tax=Salix dunnii TaxID=1413687 RepID=A0A835JDX4_9ROSI|nr:hypothetical protein SADUNF_Sadunf15G0044400 [Salix dunnii]